MYKIRKPQNRFNSQSNTYWLRLSFAHIALLLLVACHPPIENKLYQSYQNTQSWLGASAAEIIVLKGNPHQIKYLGWNQRAAVTSEFWTPELDRFMPLYRLYEAKTNRHKNKLGLKNFYHTVNTEGPWLFTYRHPVRQYKSLIRHCVEFYIIDKRGRIIEAGIQGSNNNDHKHCPIPKAFPKISKQNHFYSFRPNH